MPFDNKDMVWLQTAKKSQKQSRNMYCHCHSLLSSLSSRSLKVMLISGLVVTYPFVAFAQGVARQSILKEISSSTAVLFTATFGELDNSPWCRWIKTKPKRRNLHAYLKCTFLPARHYASAGNRDSNVSVCLSVRHAPVLCQISQNEES